MPIVIDDTINLLQDLFDPVKGDGDGDLEYHPRMASMYAGTGRARGTEGGGDDEVLHICIAPDISKIPCGTIGLQIAR